METVVKVIFSSESQRLQHLQAEEYKDFCLVVRTGQLAMMQRLIDLAPPDKIKFMLRAGFFTAVENGQMAAVERILELAHPDDIENTLNATHHDVIDRVAVKYPDMVNRLLELACVFAYAAIREQKYAVKYIYPFVTTKLAALRAKKEQVLQEHPQGVFNAIEPAEAKLYFKILEHLIRRNQDSSIDDIRFLLSIPAMKNLAQTGVDPKAPNELLLIALHIGNIEAFKILIEDVTCLNLTKLLLALRSLDWIAALFALIPSSVNALNLSRNILYRLPIDPMFCLQHSLPHVRTIYVSYNEILRMPDINRLEFKQLFPQLQNTILLDDEDNPLGRLKSGSPVEMSNNPIAKANLAKNLGFPAEVPSLQSQAVFFIKQKQISPDGLADGLKNIVLMSA